MTSNLASTPPDATVSLQPLVGFLFDDKGTSPADLVTIKDGAGEVSRNASSADAAGHATPLSSSLRDGPVWWTDEECAKYERISASEAKIGDEYIFSQGWTKIVRAAQLRVCEYNFYPVDKLHSHLRRKRSDDGQGCAARSHCVERTVCDQSVSGWPEQPPAVSRLSTDSKSNANDDGRQHKEPDHACR